MGFTDIFCIYHGGANKDQISQQQEKTQKQSSHSLARDPMSYPRMHKTLNA